MSEANQKQYTMAVGTTVLESTMIEGENYYTTTVEEVDEEEPEEAQTTDDRSDLNSLCRICATTNDYFIPIFDGEGVSHNLKTKVDKYLPIKVSVTDTLPVQVCYNCASALITWDTLVTTCLEADTKLRALQQQETEEEAADDSKNDDMEVFDTGGPPPSDDADSDDEPLIPSKAKKEKTPLATPLKKKILSKTKSKASSSTKAVTSTKIKEDVEDKERSPAEQVTRVKSQFRCNTCYKYYSKASSYEAHLKIHKDNSDNALVCPVCDAIFACAEELKIHILTHKKRVDKFTCNVCGLIFPTFDSRKKHKLVHLATADIKCKLCPKRFKNKNVLLNHMAAIHKPVVTCQMCMKRFGDQGFLKQHMATVHNVSILDFPCNQCSEVFAEQYSLDAHIVAAHDDHGGTYFEQVQVKHEVISDGEETMDPITEMSPINITFGPQQEIVVEGVDDVSKLEDTTFLCGSCGAEITDISQMMAHIAEVHCPQEECGLCSATFANKQLLSQHMKTIHQQIIGKMFVCDICQAGFTSKSGLTYHKEKHFQILYECEECHQKFRGRSGLYLHKQRVHRGRKDFGCEYCGKMFALKSQRDTHARIHTGEKPFECEVCKARFRAQSGLYAHRKTHTDERPYECEVCGKCLRLPYNLRLHMRIHTGEKPHVCDICERAFTQPGDCKKHRKTHMRVPTKGLLMYPKRSEIVSYSNKQ